MGRYIPPHFARLLSPPRNKRNYAKKEERKDRLHQNYLRRKESGSQKAWEEQYRAKRKAIIDAGEAAIRAEDMTRGVYIPVGNLPFRELQVAANRPRTATL